MAIAIPPCETKLASVASTSYPSKCLEWMTQSQYGSALFLVNQVLASMANPIRRAFKSRIACCRPLFLSLQRFQVHQWLVFCWVSFRLNALWIRVCCRIACRCCRRGGGMYTSGGATPRAWCSAAWMGMVPCRPQQR